MGRSKAQSSLDKDSKHKYVIDETIRCQMLGVKCAWTTSQIIREKKDQTSPIVEIKIVTR